MATTLTVREWAYSLGISKQAGHNAVKRCGIPVTGGKLDPEVATLLYRRRTRYRMPNGGTPASARPDPAGLLERVHALAHRAEQALVAGQFASIENALRVALQAVPEALRGQIAVEQPHDQADPLPAGACCIPLAVMDALTGTVATVLPRNARPMDPAELASMGDFWLAAAAGEVVVHSRTES
jgi:hypothetical protein